MRARLHGKTRLELRREVCWYITQLQHTLSPERLHRAYTSIRVREQQLDRLPRVSALKEG